MEMAETTTTKKKAGRQPKSATENKTETKNVDATAKALEDAMALIAQMKTEIEELKNSKPTEVQPTIIAGQPNRKVKCVSLCYYPINVSTMPDMNGKIFKFKRFGQVIQMKYDEVLDVISNYPKTIESGMIYICDRDIVEENGLEEAYEHIYDKDTVDRITKLTEEGDAYMILSMSDEMKRNVLSKTVELYANGQRMSGEAIETLREAGIDIVSESKNFVKVK